VIVGGVSLKAAPAARQDDAETASIIVNGRKGLYEHGHRGGPAIPGSNATSTCCLAEFPLLRNRGLRALAVTVLAIPLARRAAAPFFAPPFNRQRLFFVAGDRQGFPLLVRAPAVGDFAASALSGAEPVETLLLLVAERAIKLFERGLHGLH